jgi:uncharacterized protein
MGNTGKPMAEIIGKSQFLRGLNATHYTTEKFGLPTVIDIIQELEKPGRDPRPEFKSVTFKEGVEKITDLQAGMMLEGVVTNVANFGAFVDIGVHQDGLIHISHLADVFVKDPRDAVKTGQMVTVRVMDVDVSRKRIALSMKKNTDERISQPVTKAQTADHPKKQPSKQPKQQSEPQSAMENAFANALKK